MSREVWIGMVNIRPQVGNDLLEGHSGAYVNVLTPAEDLADYGIRVSGALAEMGFDVIEIDDAEPMTQRVRSYVVDPGLKQLAVEVKRDWKLRVGSFHSYTDDDDDDADRAI